MDKEFLEKAKGNLVGVSLKNGQFVKGELQEVENDFIVIQSKESLFCVELSSISSVKVKQDVVTRGEENGND